MNRGSRRLCALWTFCFLCVLSTPAKTGAHDLERTQVSLVFGRDGSFVLEVRNDPRWLSERLESIPGPFIDRIVLWVDGREIRPDSVELVSAGDLAANRMKGRVPADARTLRWYYGLVGDPYPLTIRRADGRILVEEIGGDAWSSTIDLSGQFERPTRWPIYVVVVLFGAGLVLRLRPRVTSTTTVDTESLGGHGE